MTVVANPGALLFRLRDLLTQYEDHDDAAEVIFVLAAWRELQPPIRKRISPSRADLARHDGLLDRLRGSEDLIIPVMGFLAFVDPNFFYLLRRMAARSLARRGPLSDFQRLLFARLMDSDPPYVREKIGRDVPLVLGIRLATLTGRPAERNRASLERADEDRGLEYLSGCELARATFQQVGVSMEYDAIAKRWSMRERTLLAAGFEESDVSEFCGRSFQTLP